MVNCGQVSNSVKSRGHVIDKLKFKWDNKLYKFLTRCYMLKVNVERNINFIQFKKS